MGPGVCPRCVRSAPGTVSRRSRRRRVVARAALDAAERGPEGGGAVLDAQARTLGMLRESDAVPFVGAGVPVAPGITFRLNPLPDARGEEAFRAEMERYRSSLANLGRYEVKVLRAFAPDPATLVVRWQVAWTPSFVDDAITELRASIAASGDELEQRAMVAHYELTATEVVERLAKLQRANTAVADAVRAGAPQDEVLALLDEEREIAAGALAAVTAAPPAPPADAPKPEEPQDKETQELLKNFEEVEQMSRGRVEGSSTLRVDAEGRLFRHDIELVWPEQPETSQWSEESQVAQRNNNVVEFLRCMRSPDVNPIQWEIAVTREAVYNSLGNDDDVRALGRESFDNLFNVATAIVVAGFTIAFASLFWTISHLGETVDSVSTLIDPYAGL